MREELHRKFSTTHGREALLISRVREHAEE
jgi:hypothetical protein